MGPIVLRLSTETPHPPLHQQGLRQQLGSQMSSAISYPEAPSSLAGLWLKTEL